MIRGFLDTDNWFSMQKLLLSFLEAFSLLNKNNFEQYMYFQLQYFLYFPNTSTYSRERILRYNLLKKLKHAGFVDFKDLSQKHKSRIHRSIIVEHLIT